MLKARDAAVVGRARLINTVRAMVKSLGVRLQRGSAEGFFLREAEVPDELVPAVAGLFAVLRTLNEQIAAYDAQLKQMVKETFPEAQRLCQVHGVGPVTALAFVLTLEDPERFPNGRTAAASCGSARPGPIWSDDCWCSARSTSSARWAGTATCASGVTR